MKKIKLLALSLLAVSALGLTSCGEGAQGAKGDTGEQGEKGEAGDPGKDGVDGKDGKSFLNGEGVPSDSLGNDGDSYLDTKSYDLYVKENGKWVKKGSIKGDQGEQGEKGEKGDTGAKGDAGAKGEKGDTGSTGSTGSQGDKGETAWSNTILPSKNGYVTSSVGSALKDTNVTFTAKPDEGFKLKSLTINGVEKFFGYDYSDATKLDANGYLKDGYDLSYTVQMPENGCVVQAEFIKKDAEVVGTIDGVNDISDGLSLNEAFEKLKEVDKKTYATNHGMKLPGADLKLVDNVRLKGKKEESDGTYRCELYNYGLINIVLNKRTINLNQNVDGETTYGTEFWLQNIELNFETEGTILGNNHLFRVLGAYDYPNRTDDTSKQYRGVSGNLTKLTINTDVTTKSLNVGETIGVYKTGDSSKYTNTNLKFKDNIEIQYHGIDKSTSEDGFLYVEDGFDSTYGTPKIKIGNSTKPTYINAYTHISGEATVNIENTSFDTRGTAILIEDGTVDIKNSSFESDIGINSADNHKYVQLKTPSYTEASSGSYPDNATIFVHEKKFDDLGSKITKVSVDKDTWFWTKIKTSYSGWTQADKDKLVNGWYDISEVNNGNSKVTVTSGGTSKIKSVKKADISKNHMEVTVNGSLTHKLYFIDGTIAKSYYESVKKDIAGGENLFANEYGYDASNTITPVSVTYVNTQGESVTESERYD